MKSSGITFSKLFWPTILLGILLPLTNVHMISNQIYAQQTDPQQQFQQPQQQFQQPQPSISTATNVPVGMSPFGIAYNSENGYVYVANFYSNSISVVDGFTNDLVMSIPLDSNTFPAGVIADSDNGDVYVTNFYSPSTTGTNLSTGTVSVINGSTNEVANTIQVGISPLGIASNPENGNLYVTNFYSGSISVINGSTNSVVDTIDGIQYPYQIAYNQANGNMYVTSPPTSSVAIIDSSNNDVIGNIPVSLSPLGIANNPTTGDLYVTNYNSDPNSNGSVTAIDDATNGVMTTVPSGGSGVTGITINPENGNLYVTNWYSQTVSIISTANLLQGQQQTPPVLQQQ